MKLILFEDEPIALQHIQNLIAKVRPDAEIIATADSIEKGTEILNQKIDFDLLICDIKLADGNSFELFSLQTIEKPVIFLTAYDQYALESFNHLCIDYVLKPVSEDKLRKAFGKYEALGSYDEESDGNNAILSKIHSLVDKDHYKKRFLSKVGSKVVFRDVKDIAYIYSEDKVVYFKEKGSNKRFIINYSLEELDSQLLDPSKFYRINRSIIINLDCLLEMKSYHNGRLKLVVNSSDDLDLIVAREKVSEFKNWINQ